MRGLARYAPWPATGSSRDGPDRVRPRRRPHWLRPHAADRNQCAPAGLDSATVLPKNLTESGGMGHDDEHTTATVEPLSSVNIGALGLDTPGVLTVGTLSDAPPNICVNPTGQFSGFDNQLLLAIAGKLGLQVRFVSTDFSALLAQVASRRFDVGSAAVKATDATASHRRVHQRLRLRLLLAGGAARLADQQFHRPAPPGSVSASSRAPSRSPTSSTPCTCNR